MDVLMDQLLDYSGVVLHTITSRHSVSPKKLIAPGPDKAQLLQMIEAAVSAPDHGLLRPWRFVEFPKQSRPALADLFEAALLERQPDADEEARQRARDKAARAPVLLGVIVRLDGEGVKSADPKRERVQPQDQFASAGAALQNMLILSHAMGFGARVTSGRAVNTNVFHDALGLQENETFLCFLAIGTPSAPPRHKERPDPHDMLSQWTGSD